MTRTAFLKLAATGVVAAIGLGAPSAVVMANGGEAPRANPERAARTADRAESALERGRIERAVTLAESAVLLSPNDPAHRSLLGQAYLASGRFQSAAESFDAASQLGAVDSRSIIGHALAMIATDRSAEAVALLDSNAQSLPASDYGLALAMAGQAERGALVLTDVVRAGRSSARDRQNLALAYALSSRWLEARLIAAQDLVPDQVQARMTQWTQLAQADSPAVRVASLIGARPVNDGGMPQQLALRPAAPIAPMLAASDDPAPLALYAPPARGETEELVSAALESGPFTGEVEPAPVAIAQADVPASVAAAPAPVVESNGIVFVSNPVIQPLRSMVAMVAPLANEAPAARPAPAPAARPARTAAAPAVAPAAAPTGPVRTTGWSVQLGAFERLAVAQERWQGLSRRHAAHLAAYDGVSTSATVNGRTVYRLSATGFATRAAAASTCAALVRAGGDCFVRQLPAGENVRWASRQTATRVASR
ncbi:tetratricopeptide repeat protein [Sphingomonas lacunae]|uniref:Tetratricopeptide repeat protein n=1 Tax=Sphingomonas lacunae TaxID=2698828 RepID=A0A6M4AVT5_9SPHN|nr:SPOR domain-containing protein [Sphingomonas lacunae]QJQ33184.1 tetratricopeptide repeat protein [Sphingomonas lacunae]